MAGLYAYRLCVVVRRNRCRRSALGSSDARRRGSRPGLIPLRRCAAGLLRLVPLRYAKSWFSRRLS